MLTDTPTPAPVPASQRCAVCHAAADIDSVTRQLPCGHFGFRTQTGVVISWVDTAAMTLALARTTGVAVTDRMAARAEQHGAGIRRRRDETSRRLAAAAAAGD